MSPPARSMPPCALHNPAVPLPPCPVWAKARGSREERGGEATYIVPLDEFYAFLQGVGDADRLELESMHPWLCPGHLHRIDALSPGPEKLCEAAAALAGAPKHRKRPQERVQQRRSVRPEPAAKRLLRRRGREASAAPEEGPGAPAAGASCAAAHPLYTAGSPRTYTPVRPIAPSRSRSRSLSHTRKQGHGASRGARSAPLPSARPSSFPARLGPRGSPAPRSEHSPGGLRRHLLTAAGAAGAAAP